MESKKTPQAKKRAKSAKRSNLIEDYRKLFLNNLSHGPLLTKQITSPFPQVAFRTFTTYGAYEDPI